MTKINRIIPALLSAILFISASYGQGEQERIDTYVSTYKDLAISEMLRSGVPAAITLAQGILETGGGQSDLASLAYNHFGIKCKAEWTGETISHTDDAKDECFRKYSCVQDSYKDHSDFLRTRPCYAFLFKLDPTDYEGWAKGLKKAGYATNPAYAQKLIKLIVENHLQDITLLALNNNNKQEEMLAEVKSDMILNETEVAKPATLKISEEKTKKTAYPLNKIFSINDLKVVYAEAGTSLFALANNYSISLKKLLDYNELADETDILNTPQLVFLEKKSKKGTKDIHIVEANETLRDISQEEGIQLATIMEYNGLQKGMEPAQGEKIYLKSPAPSSPRLAAAANYNTASSM
jgi:flagellum-specific peptidoglycan hydrolase FlgJ